MVGLQISKTVKGIETRYEYYVSGSLAATLGRMKPMNPKSVKQGIRQLEKYNKALGGGYTLRLELY